MPLGSICVWMSELKAAIHSLIRYCSMKMFLISQLQIKIRDEPIIKSVRPSDTIVSKRCISMADDIRNY